MHIEIVIYSKSPILIFAKDLIIGSFTLYHDVVPLFSFQILPMLDQNL